MSRDEEILRRIADRAIAEIDSFDTVAWHSRIPWPPRIYPLTTLSHDRNGLKLNRDAEFHRTDRLRGGSISRSTGHERSE